ncbi:DUF2164 domain-containing protein [Marinomonas mediterranea]|jgi:Uncharacterized conserved protein|uniref:DUF2164 domain-containing protein n=1 Tax=Marinomonas mediterranea (strain ATCC 700492 / JCM 21426 / NBRC 103028 / MMB-1) TaxID=717774 RepID=F2K2P2_MARM1|nr:DUF2164 domain-containing protein [Marinomonas mediterranea]ADZ91175.1 Protein of unknown function DUF2164 [Marinomonas mediterranea MMB-1]WCN09152.1 DUF2164 family protein [Marinomonas mediterranea]WCN13228.1 DUF2164 family protein [Marinomonas mediterranea]WCN17304.1 DUF2164 family protein [Marinomonas mediterranea MMB-1]
MKDIELDRAETEQLVSKIKRYFTDELDQDIGGFEAEFLIQFFLKELAPYAYNKGLSDAQSAFNEKADELGYLIQELEQPI